MANKPVKVQLSMTVGEGPPSCRAEPDLRNLGRVRFTLSIPGTPKVTRSVTREQLIDIKNGAAMAVALLDEAARSPEE